MRITEFRTSFFRNLKEAEFCPHENVNVIYGDNAQGKTNLLEGIWLFTGGKSFRGAKDCEMISRDSGVCSLNMDFFAGGREQNAKISIGEKRSVSLNQIPLRSNSELVGRFSAVVFSPVHLSMIKDGPSVRRKFIDAALCQIKPSYVELLSRYNRILLQRNTLLRDAACHSQLMDMLSVWDGELCETGAAIINLRQRYIKRLSEEASRIYSGISGGKEEMSVYYSCSFIDGEENLLDRKAIAGCFSSALEREQANDLRRGVSTVGPHRDNLEIEINGLSAKAYGSQGQQRSCVLALKLAEAALLSEVIGEQPVAVLDDVMSELDAGRQDYLLNRMENWQVFITCCDPAPILRLTGGRAFEMKDGILTENTAY